MFKKSLHKFISRLMLVAIIGQVVSSGLLTGVNTAQAADPVCTTGIKINEVAEVDHNISYVELYNSTETSCTFGSWIVKNKTTDTIFKQIPASTLIASHGYYVAESTEIVPLSVNDEISLTNSGGTQKDVMTFTQFLSDGYTLSLIPDGNGTWYNARATKGVTNNEPLSQPVLVDPVNNSFTNNNDIDFTWNPVVDPEGDAVHYTINVTKGETLIENEVVDSTFFKILDLEDGEYQWTVTVTDLYGKSMISTEQTFTIDTIEPSAILQNELTGSATVDGMVSLDWSNYSDSDAFSFDILVNGQLVDIAIVKGWTSPLEYLVEQTGSFSVIARDKASNASLATTVLVEKGKIVFTETNNDTDTLLGKNLSVDLQGLYLGVGTATKSDTTENPLPSELKSVGSFWTFLPNDADEEVDVSGTLKMYFTQAELDASGITDPATQIKGLYTFNEETLAWEAYGTSVYNILTNDPDDFVGELVVEVEHFSEFVAVAENIAPSAPSGVVVNYINGKLKISWNRVEGATGYRVYIGNSADPLLATLVREVGSNVTEIEQSVQTGKKYFVFVYAVGFNTLLSPASTPFEILVAAVVEPEIVFATVPVAEVTTPPSTSTFTPTPTTPQITPSPEPSPEATESEEESSTNKILIIVIILILAAGAGVGGYYGYLWWQDKNIEDSKPQPIKKASSTPIKSKTKKTSTKRKSTRW